LPLVKDFTLPQEFRKTTWGAIKSEITSPEGKRVEDIIREECGKRKVRKGSRRVLVSEVRAALGRGNCSLPKIYLTDIKYAPIGKA